MYFRSLIFLAIVSIAIVSCKKEKAAVVTPAAPVNLGPEIPGLPADIYAKLMSEVTFIDYIFHDLPFSLSQDDEQSVKQNIAFIDLNSPMKHIPANCKPFARKFLKKGGTELYHVDVYLSPACQCYVFVDYANKNKPLYANKMTPEGVQYYARVAQQARQMGQ
jgi:hypothetical protein